MNNDFDDLDRALFALPLAEPPPGLRQSILNATVYAPAPAIAAPVQLWEIVAAGTAVAIGVWLIFALVVYKGFAASFDADVVATLRAVLNPSALIWLGAGSAVTAWLTLFGPSGLRLPVRGARS